MNIVVLISVQIYNHHATIEQHASRKNLQVNGDFCNTVTYEFFLTNERMELEYPPGIVYTVTTTA
mgnify:CR=1 FL=1